MLVAVVGCSTNPGGSGEAATPAPAPENEQVASTEQALGTPVGSKLFIVGGNMTDDSPVIDRIVAEAGGKNKIKMLVVPSASATPYDSYIYMRDLLAARGVANSRVDFAKIASEDDDLTPNVDESSPEYKQGASNPTEIAKIASANVVWFSGGDQTRATNLLLKNNGKDKPFMEALRAKLAAGDLIIAGSSAGAAVMSDPMIGNGTSFAALTQAPDDTGTTDEGLYVTKGLGFLPKEWSVITDQHFAQRGRIGRLVRSLAHKNKKWGWGVSENTGFLVDLSAKRAEVVGVPYEGTVFVIGREGKNKNQESTTLPFSGKDYAVHLLSVGDKFDLPTRAAPLGTITPAADKEGYAPFSEYYGEAPLFTDAFGADIAPEFMAYVADATAQAGGGHVDGVAFSTSGGGNISGVRLRFTADANTWAYWGSDTRYALYGARLQISPISGVINGL
jgi:cyanophycinase